MIEKYRPSNGCERDAFMQQWCGQCAARNICRIPFRAMSYNIDEAAYPDQWVRDEEDSPFCKSFYPRHMVRRNPRPRCDKTLELF